MKRTSLRPAPLTVVIAPLAGCSSLEEATSSLSAGVSDIGDAVTDLFRGTDATDDPIYKCQAEGHAAGSKDYRDCVDKAVVAHCAKYGELASQPHQDCLQYYQELAMVRRQVRIYGYTR